MDGSGIAGKRLGRYQIIKHLASGGMAEVLLANATGIEGFERYVVIKRILAEQSKNAAFVQMFLDEARLAASLHHANIVQVHDIGQDGGEYFFAMEYVHGEDLRTLLMKAVQNKEQVPLEQVVTIILAAAAALHHAHELRGPDRKPLGLVHRDVSPSNILVGYDGTVKVVDFGIAKAALRSSETRSGVLKGKISYMSPEQCNGKPLDRRSDVYALGIVLYELALVRRLFKGDNDFLTMSAIVESSIPRPSLRRPEIPPELDEIILKALAKSPADRFQSCDELRVALDRFANNAGLRTSNTALGDYMVKQFGHRPEPWLIAEDPFPMEMTVNFDGSESGVAQPSSGVPEEFPITQSAMKSSPIMKARTKAISSSPQGDAVWAPDAKAATQGSGKTPMAWTSEGKPAKPAKPRRTWLVAAIGVPLVVAGIVLVTRSSDKPASASATKDRDALGQPTPIGNGGSAAGNAAAGSAAANTAAGSAAVATGSATTATAGSAATGSAATAPVAAGSAAAGSAAAGSAAIPIVADGAAGSGATTKVKRPKKTVKKDTVVKPWDPDNLLPE